MNRQYSCILADDDEIDRLTNLSFIRQYPFIQVAGVYSSAEEALPALQNSIPDIAFLDVDMPGLSGLELRRRFDLIPACIFITAFPDYAVESFELAALDFIVKPVKADRFSRTMERVQEFFIIRDKASLLDHSLGADTIFIKDGHEQVKLQLHEIVYLEALKDYTRVVTVSGKHCVLSSLGHLLKEPAFRSFIRIHRSYAVQKNFIDRVKSQEIIVRNISLPVGRQFKDALAELKQQP